MKILLSCLLIIFGSFAIADDLGNFLTGTWLAQGVAGKPCTISDAGNNKMKFVNEKGEVGIGSFETFESVIVDFPSAKGLKGEISNGNRINWSNGKFWVRPESHGEFANDPVRGDSNARVTIVEYADFDCKYCSQAHFTLKELLRQYDGKIKIVFKSWPLESSHEWSKDAAIAGHCLFQQSANAFWEFADQIFKLTASQGAISTSSDPVTSEVFQTTLRRIVSQTNLDHSRLQNCMADPATKEKIAADKAQAQTLGATAVPFFTVNGKLVEGALPIDQFKQVIDQALAVAQ